MAPLYEFKNMKTGEVFTEIMSIADREQYLEKNKDIESLISAPAICDPVRMGIRRPDGSFKDVMQKIHERTPASRLNTVSKHT